ncbi:MAG: hypothetical protein R6U43_02935 [Candidatus Krumholzibacteriales bacterium]
MKGDTRNLLYLEQAALVLHYCILHLEPSSCRSYLKLNAYPLLESLNSETVKFLNFRTVRILPELLDNIARVEPAASGEEFDSLKSSLKKRLNYYLSILGEVDESELEEDQRSEIHQYRDSSSSDSVNIILVSALSSEKGIMFNTGKVLRGGLKIEISGEGSLFRPVEPFISFEKRVRAEQDPFMIQLENSVRYAERSIEGGYSGWEAVRIPRVYCFGISGNGCGKDWADKFTGGSAGLAFTLLAGAALDNLASSSIRRRVRKDAVFTGGVDRDGGITGVEDEDIPFKTGAAFYSPCRRFVLPEENLEAASAELASLSRKYPGRKLELIPASHVSEVYDNPDIVEKSTIPPVKLLMGRARIWRKHLFAAAAACIAAVMVAVFIPARFERGIHSYKFDGETVTFFNRYGYGFDSYTPGYYIFKKKNVYTDSSSKSHREYLADINGDGEKEFLLVSVESEPNATKPVGRIHTHLFSNSGELLSHLVLWDSLLINNSGNIRSYSDFSYCYDQLADFDGDGSGELVIAATDIAYSPSLTAVVNFSNETMRYYFHRGHLKRFITGDFNQDGRTEIVLAGDRNEKTITEYAVIAALDPLVMEERDAGGIIEIDMDDYDNVALYYIKTPVSVLCKELNNCYRPRINDITVGPDGRMIVGVGENAGAEKQSAIIYEMDSRMSCCEAVFTDPYEVMYARVFDIGEEDLPDKLAAEGERLKKGFRYFDGSGWVDRPAVNSKYEKLVAELENKRSSEQIAE